MSARRRLKYTTKKDIRDTDIRRIKMKAKIKKEGNRKNEKRKEGKRFREFCFLLTGGKDSSSGSNKRPDLDVRLACWPTPILVIFSKISFKKGYHYYRSLPTLPHIPSVSTIS